MPLTEIIFCLKEIQEMKFYLRTGFGGLKASYSGTIVQTFLGLLQGTQVTPTGWFLIIFILIVYLKYKVNGVEIITAITGHDFKIATMMFVTDKYFPTLGERTDIHWYEVLLQQQITVGDWIVSLIVSIGHINTDKGSCYTIWWGWTDRKTSMLSSKNSGDIHFTKRYV